MSSLRDLLAVALVLATAIPTGGATDAEDARPTSAVAFSIGPDVFLTWTPGATPADSYTFYGVQNGILKDLPYVEVGGMTVRVDAGYTNYAVAAMVDGLESPLRYATTGGNLPCVRIDLTPPSVTFCRGGVSLFIDPPDNSVVG